MYTYDLGGNITSKTTYTYTLDAPTTVLDTAAYSYYTGTWKDLLVGYDGLTINSDTIGNPTEVKQGDTVIRRYTWEHGRQLASLTEDGTTWNYTYNTAGLRTERTNGTKTYTYVYNGSQLTYMTVDGHTLWFSYDAQGPMYVKYDGSTYQYITNLQGDIIAIANSQGNVVVEYTYDAWGNILSTSGSMASTLGAYNPLRYRSYVYDTETELYYLESRYYSPEIGRFINADALASTGQGIVGYNMFAYCNNNPVIHSDHSGYFTDGQIHDEVLKEIAKRSGDRYKYKRQDTLIIYTVAWGLKWFGFCDLYDPVTGETWELKKNTPSPSCRTEYAERQLDNYINNGYLFAKADLKLKYPTTNIPSGFFTRTDESGTQYLINYWDQGGGILRYQYFVIPSNYDILAATIVAGVFCASLSIQQGGNARIRQQQFDR